LKCFLKWILFLDEKSSSDVFLKNASVSTSPFAMLASSYPTKKKRWNTKYVANQSFSQIIEERHNNENLNMNNAQDNACNW